MDGKGGRFTCACNITKDPGVPFVPRADDLTSMTYIKAAALTIKKKTKNTPYVFS